MEDKTSCVGRGRGRRGRAAFSGPEPTRVDEELAKQVAEAQATLEKMAPGQVDDARTEGSRVIGRGKRPSVFGKGMQFNLSKKPSGMWAKQGAAGKEVRLSCNYFDMEELTAWNLQHYEVKFKPEIENARVKSAIVHALKDEIGHYIYRGYIELYTCKKLAQDVTEFPYQDKKNPDQQYVITLTWRREVQPGEQAYFMFYDILLRKIMGSLQLVEHNGTYFDTKAAINMDQLKLALYPGFRASLRSYENNVLLNVETKTRVVRTDSVLEFIEEIKRSARGGDVNRKIEEKLVGAVVMTLYNEKSYKIKSVEWNMKPSDTFETKSGKVTYKAYYAERYQKTIRNQQQPLLKAEPSKKDWHRMPKGQAAPSDILLVPELCNMTGLADEMRADFRAMKQINQHLHVEPQPNLNKIHDFMARIKKDESLQEFMSQWGINFKAEAKRIKGRVFPEEKLMFGQKAEHQVQKADWNDAFRGKLKMLSCKEVKKWTVISTDKDFQNAEALVRQMQQVGTPMGINLPNPEIKKIPSFRKDEYLKAIEASTSGSDLDFLLIVLANNNSETYGAIKELLNSRKGICSQCILGKTAGNQKGLRTIATKVVVQINSKLGGEPWGVKIPLKNAMVVGYDVYKGGKITHGQSVGAMVSTTKDQTYSSFFSCVSYHDSPDELSKNIGSDLKKCLMAYKNVNKKLPETIFFYRDGVGEGQLPYVYEVELQQQAVDTLTKVYAEFEEKIPKFAYIIVTKGPGSKFFKIEGGKHVNPDPGTVVDDEVTLPERYDFYLIPTVARQGTVSPTSFNVLYDTTCLDPDKLQRLTYKLTQLYFNWNGPVAVPATCQYAQKLATLIGQYQGKAAHEKLGFQLYYL